MWPVSCSWSCTSTWTHLSRTSVLWQSCFSKSECFLNVQNSTFSSEEIIYCSHLYVCTFMVLLFIIIIINLNLFYVHVCIAHFYLALLFCFMYVYVFMWFILIVSHNSLLSGPCFVYMFKCNWVECAHGLRLIWNIYLRESLPDVSHVFGFTT